MDRLVIIGKDDIPDILFDIKDADNAAMNDAGVTNNPTPDPVPEPKVPTSTDITVRPELEYISSPVDKANAKLGAETPDMELATNDDKNIGVFTEDDVGKLTYQMSRLPKNGQTGDKIKVGSGNRWYSRDYPESRGSPYAGNRRDYVGNRGSHAYQC